MPKLEQFLASFACRSGAHCVTCRAPSAAGQRFRYEVAGLGAFACPMGRDDDGGAGAVPVDFDPADYAKDSKGGEGCNCA